jgi:hypothetical protein
MHVKASTQCSPITTTRVYYLSPAPLSSSASAFSFSSLFLSSLLSLSPLCLSLTFLGIFALTGPSALLSFHYFTLAPLPNPLFSPPLPLPSSSLSLPTYSLTPSFPSALSFFFKGVQDIPYHHTDTMETPPPSLLHLPLHRTRPSNTHQDRRNAMFALRRFGNVLALAEGFGRGCKLLP